MSAAGNQTTKPTIVLIHGLWLTPTSWEGGNQQGELAKVRSGIHRGHRLQGIPQQPHHTVGQKGWQEVADHPIQWAAKHARGQVTLDDVKAAFVPDRPFTVPTSPDARA